MPEKLLIISPAFHGYCHSIARGFEKIGYETAVHRYDAFDTVGAKVRNKLFYELPERFGADSRQRSEADLTRRAVEALRQHQPDRVLVIKGDALGPELWEEIDRRRLPKLLWLYDDLSRHRYSLEFLRELPGVLSYASSEAQQLKDNGIRASFVPNAFDPDLAPPATRQREEIVFVGSRHPNRVELLEHLSRNGLPVHVYGRGWSHHPVDRLRTWEWSRPQLPAERDIPLSEAYRVQAEAAAALNVHGLQAGLAMRTFEVPGMNGIQLIDRPDAAEFYEPDREILIYRSPEELLELSRRVLEDRAWSERVREAGRRRTLAEHTFAHRARSIEEIWR